MFESGNIVVCFLVKVVGGVMEDEVRFFYIWVFVWGNVVEFVRNYFEEGFCMVLIGKFVNCMYVDREGNFCWVMEVEVR